MSSPQQPQQQLPDRTPRHSTPDDLQTPGQSAQPLRLFQFNYDTYTKNHLEALVEEIDELSMSQQPIEKGDEEPYWQEGSPELLPYADDDDRPVGRSAKRLRLSPEAVLHTPHAFSQPPPRTPGSALRDRIRSRRQGAGHTSTLGLSQTPMPHHSRQAQSLPAGFKSAPPPNRYLRSSLLNSKSSFDHQAETSLQVPVQQKLQAAQALMDRIIQSHSESDMNQSQQSSSEESDEAAQPSHLELQPEQQQLAQSVGAGAALLPPLLEVTEEDIEPPMDEEGHHQEEEDFDLLQPMGSPALSDGTVPLPPSPDLSQFTGTPTFAHRHHYGPSHTEARLDEEHSFADIPAPPTVTSHSQKWSSVAEANLRRSLSNHPAFVQSSPMPRQHNQNQQHLGPNSFKSSAPSQTRVTSAGSGFSTQSTGISSHTSANTHHPKYPHMTTIAPTDVDHNHMLAASERNGMVFDQQLNRWVKAKRKVSGEHTGPHQVAQARVEEEEDASEEEDPFQEFESFADKSQAQFSIPPPDWADADFDGPEPLPAEGNCEEEPEPSTDGRVPLHKLREQTPFVQTGADLVTPTEPDQSMEQQQSVLRPPLVNRSSGLSDTLSPPAFTHSASTPITHRSPSPQPPSTAYAALPGPATPMPGPRVHSAPTVPRSAMKARHSLVDSTPQPKGPNGSETSSAGMRSDAIRSVSFSDGRTSGKMADATPIVVPAFKRSSSARPSGLKNEISISSSDENSSKDLSRHSLSKPSEDDGDDSTSTATSHTDSREGSESLHLPLDVISDEDEDRGCSFHSNMLHLT